MPQLEAMLLVSSLELKQQNIEVQQWAMVHCPVHRQLELSGRSANQLSGRILLLVYLLIIT